MRTSRSKRHSTSTLSYNALIPHVSVDTDKQDSFQNEKRHPNRKKSHKESSNDDDYAKSTSQHSWKPLPLTKHTTARHYFELPDGVPSNKDKVLAEIVHSLNSSNFKRVKDFNPRTTDTTLDQILNQTGTAVPAQTKSLSRNLVEFLG